MSHMINRRALAGVILLSSLLLAGCSGLFGQSPSEEADAAIRDANESISEHNRLFDDARGTYAEVKEEIEAGNAADQQDQISEARDTMEGARSQLEDARQELEGVNDLDVDSNVKRYANLLSDAMSAQISAEADEIGFYELLQEDPALENNREEALDLLDQVGTGYQEAEDAYAEARQFADDHPQLIEAG